MLVQINSVQFQQQFVLVLLYSVLLQKGLALFLLLLEQLPPYLELQQLHLLLLLRLDKYFEKLLTNILSYFHTAVQYYQQQRH